MCFFTILKWRGLFVKNFLFRFYWINVSFHSNGRKVHFFRWTDEKCVTESVGNDASSDGRSGSYGSRRAGTSVSRRDRARAAVWPDNRYRPLSRNRWLSTYSFVMKLLTSVIASCFSSSYAPAFFGSPLTLWPSHTRSWWVCAEHASYASSGCNRPPAEWSNVFVSRW